MPIQIPYGKHTVTNEDIAAVAKVLSGDFLTQGPTVPNFEAAINRTVSSSFCIATNSATSALHIACLALDIGPGDIVWTSPITFVASANAALYCGASVDFVDIDPATGLLCPNQLAHKLQSAANTGTLPKAIIPVHLAGSSCDMEAIYRLVKPYSVHIIEDCSHAIGGSYKDHPVGSCVYSDISVFSFHPVKIMTSAEGGAATTNSAQLAHKLRLLRSHGITKDPTEFTTIDPPPWLYEQTCLGFNYRMSDVLAALGLSQLARLDTFTHHRNRLFTEYRRALNHLPVTMLSIPQHVYSSLHLAVMLLDKVTPEQHTNIFSELRAFGIGVQLHYIPVHLQPFYQRLGFKSGDFPLAEKYSTCAITLPLYPTLTSDEQRYVCTSIENSLALHL